MIAYIDTSTLVAYYCPEPMSEKVEAFLAKAERPVVSHLTEVEMVSALSRKIREKNLSRQDGNKITALFQSHLTQNVFRKIPVEAKHFMMAKNWISQFNTPLRTLDALHLAVAAAAGLPLFTADTRLEKTAGLLGIKAFGP
ncbi:MAG: type II toxin-antitoxin system VapC family toxin [Desulfobacterales bacterium]|nr:type II toxin-antitoxin system VapC family toxin [Desulfobacterales bacterium]